MTPLADTGSLSVAAVAAVARERLEDGEIVILAIRPSGWFVVLMCWPLLAGVAAVAAISLIARTWTVYEVDGQMVALACLGVAALRLAVACLQWQGRLYVLTDRRAMRIKGVFREDCYQCPLRDIREVHLSATLPDRLVAVASLVFRRADDKPVPDADWLCLANPQDVCQAVQEAMRRAK
jgi:hypothetical protein